MAVSSASSTDVAAPVYAETVDPEVRGETASALMDELLNRVGATLDDVKRVMVTLGPGSFSGLRTGVAFCQGLCFSGKRELYGVSTLQALECFGNASAEAADSETAVVIRARKDFWYLRLKGNESFIETPDVVAQLKASGVGNIVVDEPATADETLKECFQQLGATLTVDTGKPLSAWAPLFERVNPNLIQEANYIQPSYFEKLH